MLFSVYVMKEWLLTSIEHYSINKHKDAQAECNMKMGITTSQIHIAYTFCEMNRS